MNPNSIAQTFQSFVLTGNKALAWLIDPDDIVDIPSFQELLLSMSDTPIDFILVGGSLVQQKNLDDIIRCIKSALPNIPVLIFPGNAIQFSELADGILFLSLISGRNPDLLIGQHVTVAPLLAKTTMEVLPTGYMLVDGGNHSSIQYISQTLPLPSDKPELMVATALAGKYLGLQYFYLEAGSGASQAVPAQLIKSFKRHIQAPLFVGGGLRDLNAVKAAYQAGADIVVVGNAAAKNPKFLREIGDFLTTIRVTSN
ncbi:phosphoglycerol geranylgeranyltransferase [Mongoliitalea daihaiensis]|uniref:phosphoglycerol geranylgeranyltransferase n=1 Tax=Mongoliitalea daihaiensis TaxID=2782006 RepID=UPI001F1E0CA1|nr:phosphoglycerol geranylgeranyltransferase [Mongoliitalea daihaiensis]UJP65761.1 phosphoglycerol geranylgeranyltransferase [Mongoliitalea daihaiensis]